MIYIAILNTDVYGRNGMIHSKRAAVFFKRRFDDSKSAGEYLLTNHAGARAMFGDPNKSFNQITQLCLRNGRLIYNWNLKDITIDEVKDIARHITPDDWSYLFNRNPAFYVACVNKLGFVYGQSLSDDFIIHNYQMLDIKDINDSEYSGTKTVYDWVRRQKPTAFAMIESKLMEDGVAMPDIKTIINDVKEQALSIKGDGKVFNKLGAPEIMAAKSKYYSKVEYDKLVDLYKQAYWQVDQRRHATG